MDQHCTVLITLPDAAASPAAREETGRLVVILAWKIVPCNNSKCCKSWNSHINLKYPFLMRQQDRLQLEGSSQGSQAEPLCRMQVNLLASQAQSPL